MAKKILFISYDGMTDPLGQSQVLPYLIGLTNKGYQFTLLSFEKKERFKQSGKDIQAICDKNNILWIYEFFSYRPPLLAKLYDNWKIKKRVTELHKKYSFDFTHCRSYVSASAGLYLFNRKKVPFLFDMRGFWVDERVDNGQWNLKNPFFKFVYHLYKKKEKKYLKYAAKIISLTSKGKEELVANYGVSTDDVFVIPCCVDLLHFDYNKITQDELLRVRRQLGINPEDKVLSYLGSLGGWYLTQEMLEFFAVLKQNDPQVKFLFITKDEKENIVKQASSNGISPEDIIVMPASRQQVPLFLSLSNWSIFFIKDAYSKKASSPTKQGEIMAMGIPIICNDIGDTGRIIEASGTGFVVRNFSAEAYTQISQRLGELNSLDKEMIRKATFEYFDLTNGVDSYLNVYNLMK
jgi:glycosyltransferase involved in cell wall biosynthesis